MSDMATLPQKNEQCNKSHAVAALMLPQSQSNDTLQQQTQQNSITKNHHHEHEVILSLKYDHYRRIMWEQYNLLGRTRNHTHEENIARTLFAQFKNESVVGDNNVVVFYKVDKGGNKLRVNEVEALEKITRDIKRRVESIHRWFGRSVPIDNVTAPASTTAPQSSSPQQTAHDVVSLMSDAKKPPPPPSVDLDQMNLQSSSTTPLQQQQTPQHVAPSKSSSQSQMKAPSQALGGTQPNANDTVLSLYDEHYRNVMFKCFEELQKDNSRKKEISLEILNDFKKGGGRFYKVEKGGNSYTEVGEKSALQKIRGDIGRQNEISKRWNVKLAKEKAKKGQAVVNRSTKARSTSQEVKSLPQPAMEQPPQNDIEPNSTVSSALHSIFNPTCPTEAAAMITADLPGEMATIEDASTLQLIFDATEEEEASSFPQDLQATEISQASGNALASTQPAHQQCQFDLQLEEKKSDDHEMGFTATAPIKENLQDAPLRVSPSEGAFKSVETSNDDPEAKGSIPGSNVILSLNDDEYKEVMWKHYRILGKARVSAKEIEMGNKIFEILKSKVGTTGKFFKRAQDQDFEVDDQKALAKIIADIRRRMKNYPKWSGSPEKAASTKPAASPPPRRKSPPQFPSHLQGGRHPARSAKAIAKTSLSPRRSTRKPTASEDSMNKSKPGDGDVVLSLNHDEYKEIMWRNYNILGRKEPGDKVREEEAGMQIFQSLKKRLGRGGRFFKKMSHGDVVFAVDDETALQKITRDLKRRNECIHKWLGADTSKQQGQEQPQSKVKPKAQAKEEEEMDDNPLPITEEHVWRDQLAPSPIEVVNHFYRPPEPTTQHHDEVADEKSPPLPEQLVTQKSVQKAHVKPTLEMFSASHLGQRLPPLKTIPSIKSVQTPNQLIQMLQIATHKLNELNGTSVKHCKVLRLYHMPDFNDDPKVVSSKAPSLSELAEYMGTTPKSLKKWLTMYLNALTRKFNFEKFGEDKIKDHYGIFAGIEEFYQLTIGGEQALEEYFEVVAQNVVKDAEKALSQPYNIFAETPGSNKRQQSSFSATQPVASYSGHGQTGTNAGGNNEDTVIYDPNPKSPFLRNYERMEARLLDLKSRNDAGTNTELMSIQLCKTTKRVKRGTKDRMLCMVEGCEKHAQTRCDGCCTTHFRILSTGVIKEKKKTQQPLSSSHSAALQPTNDVIERAMTASSETTLGKRKVRESVPHHPHSPTNDFILDNLQNGSRVYVEWDGDNELYKATVKKIIHGKGEPMLKIHYDGKKRHIFDTIPLANVNKFIEGENQPTKQKKAKVESTLTESQEVSGKDDYAAESFPPLQKLYPGVVPPGKNEMIQPCPELGTGWQVQVVARRAHSEDNRTDRYFISPSGKKFRSVPEVERYYWQYPFEFKALSGESDTKKPPLEIDDEGFDEECEEISNINQQQHSTQLNFGSNLSSNQHSYVARPPVYSPVVGQNDPSLDDRMKSFITISPITTGKSDGNTQLTLSPLEHSVLGAHKTQNSNTEIMPDQNTSKLSSLLHSQVVSHSSSLPSLSSTIKSAIQSPKEVAAIGVLNGQHAAKKGPGINSAFSSPARAGRPILRHKLYQTSSAASNSGHFPGMRIANSVAQLRRNGVAAISTTATKSVEASKRRPKRKLKPIARFEEEEEDSPPRAATQSGRESKSVLCHCAECDKGGLSVQGIYAHYGRAHNGTLSWRNVTFSCPFCPPGKKSASRIFTSFHDAEAHVHASHKGCDLLGPKPSKLANLPTNRSRNSSSSSSLRQDITPRSARLLRERKAASRLSEYDSEEDSDDSSSEAVIEEQGPPAWAKIQYDRLLPDGKKEYPRELWRVIDMVDEQCQAQKEMVEVAREQRMKLCKSEADMEARELHEERLAYQRGIRERTRLAEGERIEKHRYTEKAEQMLLRYQYENRNKRRNQEDIEVEKLCSRPIKFSAGTQSHSTRQGKACKDDQCQFCKKEKGYLHYLLLPNEMREFNMDSQPSQTPVFKKSTNVLNPAFRIINDDYFLEAEAAAEQKDDGKELGGKRANQSRRDASTAKRLKTEEEKLWMLQNTKHSLEFIKRYNNGMIKNAWGESRKDSRGRKSY